jgi:hypothetical protein
VGRAHATHRSVSRLAHLQTRSHIPHELAVGVDECAEQEAAVRSVGQPSLTAASATFTCRHSHRELCAHLLKQAFAADAVGRVRPRSLQSGVPLPPVASHLSKVLGLCAPSTVLYAFRGVPDCDIHHHHRGAVHVRRHGCCHYLGGKGWIWGPSALSRSSACARVTLCGVPSQRTPTRKPASFSQVSSLP